MSTPLKMALLVAFGSGCVGVLSAGAAGSGPVLPAGQTLTVSHPTPAPEVADILAELYGPTFDPDGLKGRVQAALGAHPDDPDLNEAAAYLAMLEGDTDATELHLIKAAMAGGVAPLVYLRGFDTDHALAAQASRILVKRSPDPEVRAAARRILLQVAYDHDDKASLDANRKALGVLTHWRLLGAFDNDEGKGFLVKYPPEQGLDFAATYPGVLLPIHWREVSQVAPFGDVRFESLVWPNRNAVAYALSYFQVDQPQAATLWLSTGSPLRVFLDGKLVSSHETVVGGNADKIGLKLNLAAGAHSLLLKSANKSSHWYVAARIETPEGDPVPGLVELSGPPTALSTATAEEIPGVHDLAAGLSAGRSHFLSARLALRAGDPKLAVREAASFAQDAEANPLALWSLASAANVNEEQGKALDLLNEGVKRWGDKLPHFYFQRSRAYIDKGLLEKAQIDAEDFLRLRPHDVEGQLLLAEIEGKRSFSVERCRTLAEAVTDHPQELRGLRELSGCELEHGHVAKARALLDRARKIAPGDDDTLFAAFELERRTFQLRAAAALAEKRRLRLPDWTPLWIENGEIAEQQSHFDEARKLYLGASELSPDHPSPYTHLAELAYDRGDIGGATQLWTQASLRDPASGLLSERLEHLNPTKLGFIEKLIPTDDAIDAAVKEGTKRAPQDGSQSMLLLDDEVTQVHVDGSSTRVVTTVTRAVNDQGRDQLIQAFVPTQGRVKILKAYAVSTTGERQEASSVRNGVFRFRNLTVGSTVVLQYVHYAPAAPFLTNEFMSVWSFQSVAREHELSRWSLVLPKGRKLHVQITGDVQHTQADDGDYTVYRFEAHDVPPFIEEPSSPPLHDLLRHVSVTTIDGWEDHARWERALLADAFQESQDLGTLAHKLTDGAKTPRERLDKLTSYVAEQIRYQMDYETNLAGVRPHSSRQVLERGYADCKDKAVFLISLAREVGIKLDYALLLTFPQGRLEREAPVPQFNHAIVYVPKQEGLDPMFVDATTDGLDVGSLRDDDQGATSLVFDPVAKEGYDFIDIPFRAPTDEYNKSAIHIAVGADDTVKLSDRLESRGGQASLLRRFLKTPAYARKLDEQLAATLFPASTLTDASAGDPSDVWHPMWISLDVDDSNALETSGAMRRLRLPAHLGLDRLTGLALRKTPLRLGVPQTDEQHVVIDLPKGSKLVELPKDFSEEAKCLAIRRSTKQRGDQIDIDVKVVRTCDEVSPQDYPSFRAHVLKVMSQMEQQVAFAGPPDPNAKVKAEK